MAKFCAKCGSPMEDGDRVCGQCGTPVANAGAAAPVNPAPQVNPTLATNMQAEEKKDAMDIGKIVKLAIAAVVAVVVIIVAVCVLKHFTGYKPVIGKMVKALQNDDTETLISLASETSNAIYESRYGDNFEDKYEKEISNALDKFEDKVGVVKKISYEITNETELSKRRKNEIEDDWVDSYEIDTSDVKDIVLIDLKLTVKGDKKSSSYKVNDLMLVKEKGGWKLLNY